MPPQGVVMPPLGGQMDASAAVGDDGFGVVGGTLRTSYAAIAALEGEG